MNTLEQLPPAWQAVIIAMLLVGGVLLAAMAAGVAQGSLSVAELLITLFIFVTAPVSANLLAQAALHRREPSVAPPPPEQPLR